MNRPKFAPSSAAAPKGAAVLLVRKQLAADRFVAMVVENYGLTRAQAMAAMNTLLKARVLELGANDGQFRIKHGAFCDPVVMRRAAGLPDEPEPVVRPGSILW